MTVNGVDDKEELVDRVKTNRKKNYRPKSRKGEGGRFVNRVVKV